MPSQLRDHAERNLSSLVVAIEFTLISVMVGVILFPLMDFATPILRELKFQYMPYILCGLLLILFIWTEVISHSLSFIGWPIDLLHNLFYIVFAMVLAIQMHFLQEPQLWFAMTLVSALVATGIAYYDMRLIEERRKHSPGAAAARMYDAVWQKQRALVRTAPYTVGNAVLQLALIYLFPGLFLQDYGHLILVTIQILAFGYLISRTIRQFKALREVIVSKAVEELEQEQQPA